MSGIIHKPMYTEQQIAERVKSLAESINEDYKDREIDIICLLNGASVFCSDMLRHLTVPVRMHPFCFSSYSPASLSGEVRITLDVPQPMLNKHVLILEGIIISGRTPKYIYDLLQLRQPASLEFCAVGTKPAAMTVNLPVKYKAFEFGSEMVVGYGIGEGSEKALPFLAAR